MGSAREGSPTPPRMQRRKARRLRQTAGGAPDGPITPEAWSAFWAATGTPRARIGHRLLKLLPRGPRCGICSAPFGGFGRYLVWPFGYRPSRKNPNVCATCVELSPAGGMLPDAIIDKLIGDEVMALYIPEFVGGKAIPDLMLEHARQLLSSLEAGSEDGSELEVGIGLDYGEAFVGNIGQRAIYDFTAVGDVVNVASRLTGQAGAGEVLISERVARGLSHPAGERVELELKGKAMPEVVYRVAAGRAEATVASSVPRVGTWSGPRSAPPR
jgi:adenylate cyclase